MTSEVAVTGTPVCPTPGVRWRVVPSTTGTFGDTRQESPSLTQGRGA